MKKGRDDLEQFLEEEGILEEVRAMAQKKILAETLRSAMKAMKITPARLAMRMGSSRPTVYRLLDAKEPGITLETLTRASEVLNLQIVLVPRAKPRKKAA